MANATYCICSDDALLNECMLEKFRGFGPGVGDSVGTLVLLGGLSAGATCNFPNVQNVGAE